MDPTLVAESLRVLGGAPLSRLVLLDARTLAAAHVLPHPPDIPVLLLNVESPEIAVQVQTLLLTTYPKEHVVLKVEAGKQEQGTIAAITGAGVTAQTCYFVPAMAQGTSFESFVEIVAHLRAPNGCPWDREQTHATLRKHLLEETYEAISAIDSGDFAEMREEFGDLLLQIVLQSQIATEEGQFNISQVIQGVHSKIVRRHPHVFGDVKLDGVAGVLANWEKLKEQERAAKRQNGEQHEAKGLLDGVPKALPALSQAQEYQDRVARVGFDWADLEGVLDKVKEEIEEVKNAESNFELASELGDLLFALVNVARWKHIDSESALRGTNLKFKRRFAFVEQEARKQGRDLSGFALEEMEALWQEAKKRES